MRFCRQHGAKDFSGLSILRYFQILSLCAASFCAVLAPTFAQAAHHARSAPTAQARKVAAAPLLVLPKPERPYLVVDVASGLVLDGQEARTIWHPASLTKMMTAYVAFRAIQSGRIRFDSPLTVSAYATSQKPSKMGFKPGSLVSLEAALYMIMVKSANDMAVSIAEGVSGSVPAFVTEMNSWSRQLGMSDTNWANPNGLPDPAQLTSARDLAILARALIRDFPQFHQFLNTEAIQVGPSMIKNHNPLLGRFEGADGIKTGYICDSGFNIVATATRGSKRYIAVVLGADSSAARDERAALLLEKAFAGPSRAPGQGYFNGSAAPAQVTLAALPAAAGGDAVKMKQFICGRVKRTDMEDVQSDILAFAPGAAANTGLLAGTNPQRKRASLLGPRTSVQPLYITVDEGDKSRGIPLRAALTGRALPELPAGLEAAPPPQQQGTIVPPPLLLPAAAPAQKKRA